MKLISFLRCWCLGLLTVTAISQAAEYKYFYSALPPFEYVNESGQADGIAINHMTAIFHEKGHSLSFVYNSINRGIRSLETGEADFASVIEPTGIFLEDFVISNQPIMHIKLGVFRNAEKAPVSNFSELLGDNVVSLENSQFHFLEKYTSGFPEHVKVDSFENAIQLLSHNKVDYLLSYEYTAYPTKASAIEFDTLLSLPVYLAISKKHPRVTQLVKEIDLFQ